VSKLQDRATSGSGRRTTRGAASREDAKTSVKRVRSTVDLDEDVNRKLRVAAVETGLSLQAILEALGNAYAAGDGRAIEIVQEAISHRR